MATSSIAVTEGSGKNIATHSISEDLATKQIQRVALNTSAGVDISPLSESDFDTKVGSLTESAPATDTASSGLNGRLQRIAQRITSFIALIPAALTGSGNFKVAVQEALPAGTNNIGDVDIASIAAGDNNIGNVDVVTLPNVTLAAGTNTNEVVGDAAHDAAVAGNPVLIGVEARSSEGTAVSAAGDVTRLMADLVGKLIVLPYANPENFVSGAITTAMTGTTSTSLIAAPAVGLRNYITQITVSNAHATVGTDIIIQDGSAGTTLYTIPAAAVYGGAVVTFPTPLRQPTTATAIYCANVTTGASTKVSASGYKGQ